MLTKSNFLTGLECPRLLWITKNNKEILPKPTKSEQKIFDTGTKIGELAKEVYPEGIDIQVEDIQKNIEESTKLIKQKKTLFEPTITINNLYSRADVLKPIGNEWDIIEVKSGTKVKDTNIQDVAFQKYVYELAGLKIRKCYLMHIDNTYIKNGKINPKDLFIKTDITNEVSLINNIEEKTKEMLRIINLKEPPEFNLESLRTIKNTEYTKKEFLESLPNGNVFELSRGKEKAIKLFKEGIKLLEEIPYTYKLTKNQEIQRGCGSNGVLVNKEKIKRFLSELKYPLYLLDFECINPCLPLFDGMKAYQQICFQYSLHILEENGELKHISFLADGKDNPTPKFLKSLVSNLASSGDIIVYNQSFEKSRLKEGVLLFPEFKDEIGKILDRIKDLWTPFKNFDYYSAEQKGSASIKKVLPLFTDMSYKDLVINNGMDASMEYERVSFTDDDSDKAEVREALEKYCELDTLAEVKIIDGLSKVVN